MMFSGFLEFKLKPEYQMENQLRTAINNFKKDVAQGNVDYEDYNNYRITVTGLEAINEIMSNISHRENHVIFSMF